MTDESKKSISDRRKEALEQHEGRAREIQDWSQSHGGVHPRVNRYTTRANAENVKKLIDLIQSTLENRIHPDAAILLEIMAYLQKYDFTSTDEVGRDTKGFSLAVSEIDVALVHLAMNPDNALRYLIYRYRAKVYSEEKRVGEFPIVLYIEAALACNLMCLMCYQSDPELERAIKVSKKKIMDWDLYQKVVDEVSENGLCAIVFAGRGEPTLNPRFSQMLKYAHEKGIFDIKIHTNATKLTETMVREWLSIGAPLTVVFSVDAADKEGFEAIRIGANFDQVVANIKMFHRIRATEFPNSPVRTRIFMTLFRDDQDPAAARQLWGGFVDEFTAKNARSEESGSIYQTGADGKPKNVNPAMRCRVFFDRLYVWCDGTVNPCEEDYLSRLRIGNAYHQTLKSLWMSPEMMKLRIRHMSGCKNTIVPCNGCTGF